jgi:hypothetical protein
MHCIAKKHYDPLNDIKKICDSILLQVENSYDNPIYFQIHLSSRYIDKIEFENQLETKILIPQSEWHSFEMKSSSVKKKNFKSLLNMKSLLEITYKQVPGTLDDALLIRHINIAVEMAHECLNKI